MKSLRVSKNLTIHSSSLSVAYCWNVCWINFRSCFDWVTNREIQIKFLHADDGLSSGICACLVIKNGNDELPSCCLSAVEERKGPDPRPFCIYNANFRRKKYQFGALSVVMSPKTAKRLTEKTYSNTSKLDFFSRPFAFMSLQNLL